MYYTDLKPGSLFSFTDDHAWHPDHVYEVLPGNRWRLVGTRIHGYLLVLPPGDRWVCPVQDNCRMIAVKAVTTREPPRRPRFADLPVAHYFTVNDGDGFVYQKSNTASRALIRGIRKNGEVGLLPLEAAHERETDPSIFVYPVDDPTQV